MKKGEKMHCNKNHAGVFENSSWIITRTTTLLLTHFFLKFNQSTIPVRPVQLHAIKIFNSFYYFCDLTKLKCSMTHVLIFIIVSPPHTVDPVSIDHINNKLDNIKVI